MSPDTLTEQLSLFLDVLESGSFSAAARRHPLTPQRWRGASTTWKAP